jgi:DNA repair exonuclease SbcCD ATPase subunit
VSFISNLLGVKTDQAVESLITTLVQWDPQSATEAELRTMEDHLDELGRQVAAARTNFDKEKREADAIQLLADQRLAAANQLQTELDQTSFNTVRKAEIERSLTTLVNLLEEMAPDVDREKQDATDAAEFLQMLRTTYEDAANKLRNARSALGRAHRDMDRAAQQRQMAERQAEAARQAAGLSGATSGLSVALKAMQDTAQRNPVEAEAAKQKVRLLAPTTPEKDDPNIALAMARVRGQTPPSETTLAYRLATLQARQIGRS